MPFTIATYNVRDLVDIPSPPPAGRTPDDLARAQEAKFCAVAQVLGRLDADVICLQEANNERLLRAALGRLPAGIAPYRSIVVGKGQDKRGLRLALLSRFEIAGDVRHHDPSEEPAGFMLPVGESGTQAPGPFHFRRGLIEATLKVPAVGDLTVFCAHLKSNYPVHLSPPRTQGDLGEGTIRATMVRMAEALRIRRLVDERLGRDPEGLLVVGGDFNETETSQVHRIIAGDRPDEIRLGLTGRPLYPCSMAVPSGSRWSNLYRGRRELLDHLLVSPGLYARFKSAQILNDSLFEPEEALGGRADLCPESDHAPLVARFH